MKNEFDYLRFSLDVTRNVQKADPFSQMKGLFSTTKKAPVFLGALLIIEWFPELLLLA
jgi:hypothetical protein